MTCRRDKVSKKRKNITIQDRDRWIADWNKHKDSNYKSYINTRDIASLGNKHRVAGAKSGGREHQLLSTNEYYQFLHLEFDPTVKNIYEQYLLPLDQTTAIAEQLGVKHPIYTRSKGQIKAPLTTDFYVEHYFSQPKAFSVKDTRDAEKDRTKEKQMIERASWELKNTPWEQVLDTSLKTNFSRNLELLFPFKILKPADFYENLLEKWLPNFMACISDEPYIPLAKVVETAASNIGINYDMSKDLLFHAIWHRRLTFNFNLIIGLELSATSLSLVPNDID